jgi:septum formation inhibitor MinC
MVEPRWQTCQHRLDFRGTRDGLVIRLPLEPTSLDLVQDVQDDVERSRDFFGHGEIVIDYDARLPDLEEIRALHEVLRERGIRLRIVIADATTTGKC